MGPRLFVVCTRGCTASRWLARSLNGLDGVECRHGTAGITGYDRSYERTELVEAIHREWFERQVTPVVEHLRSTTTDPSASLAGNVHRYQLHRHRELLDLAPQVAVANVIRHPVTWLDSRTALFAELREFVPHIGQQLHYAVVTNFDRLWPFVQRHGLNPADPELLCFVGSIVAFAELAADAAIERWPSYRMEDLVADRVVFADLVAHISAGTTAPSEADLDAIVGGAGMHRHREGDGDPATTFAGWPAWKRELFVSELVGSGLGDAYRRFDYGLDDLVGASGLDEGPRILGPTTPGGPFWISVDG